LLHSQLPDIDGSPHPANNGDIEMCPEPQPEPEVQIKEEEERFIKKRPTTKRSSSELAFNDEDETPEKTNKIATPPEGYSG
jgi:hypothetical protein